MTIDRETVIRLAAQSGVLRGTAHLFADELQCFAALVLEHGRKPLTGEQVDAVACRAGYTECMLYEKSDFINGIRHGEFAHGITNKGSSDAE